MKKTKIIIPAMGMLLLSTAASVTGTVAWFSMNNSVTASGMQLKVKADDGILISTSAKSAWTDSAVSEIGVATLLPTSAAAVANPAFVTANSSNANDAQAHQDANKYQDLSLTWTTSGEGIGYVETSNPANTTFDDGESAYVLLTKYFIKSSGANITQDSQDPQTLLYLSDVTATFAGNANAVDNSLRVLIVVGNAGQQTKDVFLYAPIKDVANGTTTMNYYWKNGTSVAASAPTVYNQPCTNLTTISYQNANAVEVDIYCYFEGEDANCKSTNISGIEMHNLSVTVNFATIVKDHQ